MCEIQVEIKQVNFFGSSLIRKGGEGGGTISYTSSYLAAPLRRVRRSINVFTPESENIKS